MDINELINQGKQKYDARCAEKAAAEAAVAAAEAAATAAYSDKIMLDIRAILPDVVMPYLNLPIVCGHWSLEGEIMIPGLAPILIEYIPELKRLNHGYGIAKFHTGDTEEEFPPDYFPNNRHVEYVDDILLAIGAAQEQARRLIAATEDYDRRLEARQEQRKAAIEAAPPYRPETPNDRLREALREVIQNLSSEILAAVQLERDGRD